jgi:hypothetical protein
MKLLISDEELSAKKSRELAPLSCYIGVSIRLQSGTCGATTHRANHYTIPTIYCYPCEPTILPVFLSLIITLGPLAVCFTSILLVDSFWRPINSVKCILTLDVSSPASCNKIIASSIFFKLIPFIFICKYTPLINSSWELISFCF